MDRGLWFYFLFPNIHPRFPGKDASAQTFYESMTIRISKDLEKFLRFEKTFPFNNVCVGGEACVLHNFISLFPKRDRSDYSSNWS